MSSSNEQQIATLDPIETEMLGIADRELQWDDIPNVVPQADFSSDEPPADLVPPPEDLAQSTPVTLEEMQAASGDSEVAAAAETALSADPAPAPAEVTTLKEVEQIIPPYPENMEDPEAMADWFAEYFRLNPESPDPQGDAAYAEEIYQMSPQQGALIARERAERISQMMAGLGIYMQRKLDAEAAYRAANPFPPPPAPPPRPNPPVIAPVATPDEHWDQAEIDRHIQELASAPPPVISSETAPGPAPEQPDARGEGAPYSSQANGRSESGHPIRESQPEISPGSARPPSFTAPRPQPAPVSETQQTVAPMRAVPAESHPFLDFLTRAGSNIVLAGPTFIHGMVTGWKSRQQTNELISLSHSVESFRKAADAVAQAEDEAEQRDRLRAIERMAPDLLNKFRMVRESIEQAPDEGVRRPLREQLKAHAATTQSAVDKLYTQLPESLTEELRAAIDRITNLLTRLTNYIQTWTMNALRGSSESASPISPAPRPEPSEAMR